MSVSRCRALKITPKQPYGSWQKTPAGKTACCGGAFPPPLWARHGPRCRKKFPRIRTQPSCHPTKRSDPPAPEAAPGPAQSRSEPSSAAADAGGHFTPRANLPSRYIEQSCLEESNFVLWRVSVLLLFVSFRLRQTTQVAEIPCPRGQRQCRRAAAGCSHGPNSPRLWAEAVRTSRGSLRPLKSETSSLTTLFGKMANSIP